LGCKGNRRAAAARRRLAGPGGRIGGAIVSSIFIGGCAFVVIMGAVYWLAAPPDLSVAPAERKPLRRFEWALPVGALVGLFGLFVLVQLAVLFGGSAYVRRTSGLTAADYARRGFWQLCVVTVLALVVIGVTARRAAVDSRSDRIWLRSVLGALTGLTLVVVASALTRMWAYQEAYGHTVLRLLVGACEVWLGVVCLMVLAAGVTLRAPWLPRAIVGSAVLALLVLAVLNPDGFVAASNVDRYDRIEKIDVDYLSGLSVDAAPELARLPEPARSCALSRMGARLDRLGPDGWLDWNLGRAAARDVIGGGYVRPGHCG
jgi:hypothetical protein